MSDVLDVASVFPPGTTVGAYAGRHPAGKDPGIAAATTAAVQTNGTLTFTGLTAGTQYTAMASLSSTWPAVGFTSGEDIAAGDEGVTEDELTAHTVSTAQIEDDAVTQAKVGDDAVGLAQLKVTIEDVTVTAGNPSGTATVAAGAQIIGYWPAGNQDQHVDSIAIASTTLTVTLAANATADNVFKVAVLEA